MAHPHLQFERIAEQTVFSRVREMLAEYFGIATNDVELDSVLVRDLGIEPADIEYLALTLEAVFDIDITIADASRIVRVRDAVRCILGPGATSDVRSSTE